MSFEGSESDHTPEIGPDGQPIFPLEDANDKVANVPSIEEQAGIDVAEDKPIVAKISGYNEKLVMQQLEAWRKVPIETILPLTLF